MGLGDTLGVLPELNGGTGITNFDAYVKGLVNAAKSELQQQISDISSNLGSVLVWTEGHVSSKSSYSYSLYYMNQTTGTLSDFHEVLFGGYSANSNYTNYPCVIPTVLPVQIFSSKKTPIKLFADGRINSSSGTNVLDNYGAAFIEVSGNQLIVRVDDAAGKDSINYCYFR